MIYKPIEKFRSHFLRRTLGSFRAILCCGDLRMDTGDVRGRFWVVAVAFGFAK
jgi:hypothetical protein